MTGSPQVDVRFYLHWRGEWTEPAAISVGEFIQELLRRGNHSSQGGFVIFLDGQVWNGYGDDDFGIDHYAGAMSLAASITAFCQKDGVVEDAGWQVDMAKTRLERKGNVFSLEDTVYEFPRVEVEWNAIRKAFAGAITALVEFLEKGLDYCRRKEIKLKNGTIFSADELRGLKMILAELEGNSSS